MAWVVLIAVIAVFLGVPYWMLLAPLSRVVLRVISIARDPMHRSTPEGPWELFDRIVWARLGPIWLLWTAMLFASCLIGPMLYIILGPYADRYPLLFFYALLYPAHLAGSWSMAFAELMLLAPRGGSAGLMARITMGVLVLQLGLVFVSWTLLARGAGLSSPGKEMWASFAVLTLLTGVISAALSWARARKLGDAWFEFEDDKAQSPRNRFRR